MQKFYLENMNLKVTINQHGAELASILNKENGSQYLWNADESFWKRSAPVLFPIVGSLKDKKQIVDGEAYEMSQHGFARDCDFKMDKQKDGKSITFTLTSNEATRDFYPYDFELKIIYTLDHYTLNTEWQVKNTGDKAMFFQIGGHPAFMCPAKGKDAKNECFLKFDTDKDLNYYMLEGGLVKKDAKTLKTDNGLVKIEDELLANDALIFEHNDVHKISLADSEKEDFLSVYFDAPVFGIWSPKAEAPFVCIEPWYGRADATDFEGDITKRDYINELAAGETFTAKMSFVAEK